MEIEIPAEEAVRQDEWVELEIARREAIIREELENQYKMTYRPPNLAPDYETIKLQCIQELRDERDQALYESTRAKMEVDIEHRLMKTLPQEIEARIR